MKLAIICDWLTGMRGGERCLEAIGQLYPDADIFTLIHVPGSVSKEIESHNITVSYIQRLPGGLKKFRRYLPIFPNAIKRFNLNNYECVLSLSHSVAKGVKVPKKIPHICYCYTPMRYAWMMRDDYLKNFNRVSKFLANILLNYLKAWDRKSSSGVTHFVAISKNVKERIKRFYARESIVIYPPVDCNRFQLSRENDGYYLVLSALVPYKRIDLAVEAFKNLRRKLMVVGNGPELSYLKKIKPPNVSIITNASDTDVQQYMKKCCALIFPGEEDFGIVPLEAQASGKPVIAFGKGGALETVIDLNACQKNKATGIFFYEQTSESLVKAVLNFEENMNKFDANACRKNAMNFDKKIYSNSMNQSIQNIVKEHNQT